MGRFDDFAPMSEQINMPPSLLSRFDLIFVMKDKPNNTLDRAIGEHILKAHEVGELIEHTKKEAIEGVDAEYIERALAPVTPDIDPALFRKYIAYSKRNCFPLLSKEAKEKLIDYYLSLRGFADDNKPVPVTARQLEALVRLSEASARVRLSKKIETEDAERVIRIVDRCLRDVAYDPNTESFDIDKLVTGIPKQRRDIIREIKETIRNNADDNGYTRIEEVQEILQQKGHNKDDIRKRLDDLLRSGEAMEPRHGIIKLI
jgi:replicative DNA helicase Mcm